jgi:hypothetical protein
VIVSSSVSLALWALLRSVPVAVGSWITGVLIDLDHVLEYFVQRGPLRRIDDLFHASYNRVYTKAYLILHGWELIALWIALCVASSWNPWVVGGAIGFTHHLTLDQIWNKPARYAYWLVWRAHHRFSYDATFPPRRRKTQQRCIGA